MYVELQILLNYGALGAVTYVLLRFELMVIAVEDFKQKILQWVVYLVVFVQFF